MVGSAFLIEPRRRKTIVNSIKFIDHLIKDDANPPWEALRNRSVSLIKGANGVIGTRYRAMNHLYLLVTCRHDDNGKATIL
jgi:hypothetical protein